MANFTRRGALMTGGAMIALAGCGEAAKPAGPDANAAFDAVAKTWLDELAKSSPTYATQLGDHRFDAELPDVSETGRKARAAQVKATQETLAAIDHAALSRDNQVDAAMLAESRGPKPSARKRCRTGRGIRRAIKAAREARCTALWRAILVRCPSAS